MAQSRDIPTQAPAETDLHFGPFRLEKAKRLWRGEHLVEVRPRPLAVLRYLAERPGRLVTGEELLKRLWPGIYVTKTVLRVCIREVRQALDEDPVAPQFIETVGRQGYRFVGTVSTQHSAISAQLKDCESHPPQPQHLTLATQHSAAHFVGREQALARLHELFARAQHGDRQTMFVFGEAGIGKTTLVDRFLAQVQTSGQVRIGRGQCIEQYGPGEAYLPLLEALGEVCRAPGGEQVLAVLRRHAPLWVVQLGGLVAASEREALQRQVQGSSRERMLRELAEAVEALAVDVALVLVLEDLQWSDGATLEAVAYLAQRRRSVRLYILGTYRPAEVVMQEHRLRAVVQELYGRRQCEELALELFTEAEVEEYLRQRFGQRPVEPALGQLIYHRTDGNALFVVSFVDYLLRQELLAQAGSQVEGRVDLRTLERLVPGTLQQVILRQIEHLGVEEQHLLEVASGGGRVFTAAEVAGVSGRTLEEVEAVCDQLAARERVIGVVGLVEWPEGTVTVRYEFRHVLYQQVLYEQLGQARRVRLHRLLGERKELGYGARAGEIAGKLAVHFTEGRDYRKAVQYHSQAGERALRRSAYHEAIAHCQAGLALLARLPDTPERAQRELMLLMTLGVALIATNGYAASEVEQTYLRARRLCEQVSDTPHLFSALYGLWNFYAARSDLQTAYGLAEQLLDMAQRADDSALQLIAHWAMGLGHSWYGHLTPAREHLEQVLVRYDPLQHGPLVFRYGQDVKVTALSFGAITLWLLGYPDRARRRNEETLTLSQELIAPFNVAYALANATLVHQLCQEAPRTRERAEATIAFASEQGFPHWEHWGAALRGWALTAQGEGEVGITLLREGLAALAVLGVRLARPHLLALLAEAYGRMGQIEEGLTTLAEALMQVHDTGECYYEAELYRLKGELTLQKFHVSDSRLPVHTRQETKSKGQKESRVRRLESRVPSPRSAIRNPQSEAEAEAEQYFHKAIAIARQQEAKLLELRAVMSLGQLWQHQGKRAEARTLLAGVYGWFSEGFDTADLREAKALLDALRA